MSTKPPSPVETIKLASRFLRGTIVESLADPVTGAIAEADQSLLKFHGSYQQDDRDVRDERRLRKLEPAYSFMVRARLPGGVITAAQWLSIDAICERHANGTLRLTTRQTFQLHGVVKGQLKPAMRALNDAMIDTLATCGDVNRNVMAGAGPEASPVHAQAHAWAARLSEHLLPRTRAYHEIWLDGERVGAAPESEPIYGATYLPRKFKAAIAVPPCNDVDIYTQDLGFVAIADQNVIAGFNLIVGGGMGATHGDDTTYPRLGTVIGYLRASELLDVATAVLSIQRDHGDRSNRRHARLKYTIDDRGIDWFRSELNARVAKQLEPPRPFEFTSSGDQFGWHEGTDRRWHLTLRIPAGRIVESASRPWRSGLRAIAAIHGGTFRMTANQNLTISGVDAAHRAAIDLIVAKHALNLHETATPVARDALACVALPTCPLAMAEAERYLPALTDRIETLLDGHGLRSEPLLVRITGCPNGCARPYVAEIALIGKAPGRYNLHLGGDSTGVRLNRRVLENADEALIFATLDSVFRSWAAERLPGERLGDFVVRTGHTGVSHVS